MIVALDKPSGWTPLEALDALRSRTSGAEPMVYAGRLDPMAEGVLLVLTGEDRHALPEHLGHDKEYVATVLFGVTSDTFDALGRITLGTLPDPDACATALAGLVGAHPLPLPAWSAYKVRGRPLHAWAAEGRLGEIELPVREMRVTTAAVQAVGRETLAGLLPDLRSRIGRVRGTFRQAEALADWEALAGQDPPVVAIRARLTVTSGTYVRSLAHAVGQSLGCGALLLALRRTRVGPWGEGDAERVG